MVLNGKFIEILHFGLMYVRKSEIISIVETADMFFQEKILTYYRRQKATLKNRLEQISLEEEISIEAVYIASGLPFSIVLFAM